MLSVKDMLSLLGLPLEVRTTILRELLVAHEPLEGVQPLPDPKDYPASNSAEDSNRETPTEDEEGLMEDEEPLNDEHDASIGGDDLSDQGNQTNHGTGAADADEMPDRYFPVSICTEQSC